MSTPNGDRNADPTAQPGRIVTFYSYKGGTGRTMTVANIAWLLASNGLRVLTVDWDLESPGLHRYFHPFLLDKQLRSSRGVIDMIRDFSTAAMDPLADQDDPAWFEQYADVLRYAVSLDWPFGGQGMIDFLPAGLQDPPYSRTVSTFDWPSFYDRHGGGIFLEALRRNMREHYDYVLIDSRTGLSDTAGICTVQLPDVVANCFTMSTQSIDGAASVAHSIRSQRADRPVRMLPVPMRVEDAEQIKLEAGRDYARMRFESFLTDRLSAEDVDRYWGDVEIPYKPFYAYEEILSTFGDRSRQENSLLAAFERLANVLTEGQVQEMTPIGERQRRRWLAEFERSKPMVTSDIFISFAAMDRMWAEWISAELADVKLRVVLHEIEFGPETATTTDVDEALSAASRVLVLLSQDYVKSANAIEFWKKAVNRGADTDNRFLVPVRLDTVRLAAPFVDRLPVDLAGLTAERSRDVIFAALDQPSYPTQLRPDGEWWGPRFPANPPPVSNLPQRNGSFTGRAEALASLRNRLSGNVTVVVPQALFGLGGVGKTQVVLEYAYRFAANYDVIWWISAEQLSMVRTGLANLAAQLQLPTGHSASETVQSALNALRQGRPYQRWLLIFDNADDPDELRDFVPNGPGHVVVTSRNQAWARQATAVEIGVFSRQESVACLRKRVPTLAEEEANLVAEKLGDLPLAIEQAGAWLAATAMPAARYLELLDTQLPAILEENPPPDYQRTAAATWLLSLDRLREHTPAAAKLLELCAFFAPEPIPMSLIFSDRFVSVLLQDDPSLRDPLLQGRVIREIGRYALARVDSRQTGIQIHRLVQAVIRDTLSPEERRENQRHVHEVLAAANPKDTDRPDTWATYAELWPHLVPSHALNSTTSDVRQLIVDLVRFLWKRSDYTSSQELAEQTLQEWGATFPPDDPISLVLRVSLANALRSQANYAEAQALDQEALERLRAANGIGENHPYTLMAASGLAADLRAIGDYPEARRLDNDTFTRLEDVFGEDHPRTLMAGHNLAVSLRLVGDFEGATRLDEDTLERRRKVLGERHPYTLFSANDLGRDLREAGQFRRSRELLEVTLADYRQVVGDKNAETLWTAKNLAVTLRKLGEFSAAKALTSETLTLHERLHGPNHPDTLACLMNLGCDQSALGDDAAARQTVQVAYDRYCRVLGDRHPFSLACANNLSIFTRKGGDHESARAISERVVEQFKTTLGENHPYTLACVINLTNDMYAMGEYSAARRLDEDTYARIRRALGEDHPDMLAAASNLAISRRADGDRTGGQVMRERTLVRSRHVLGDNHPNTVAVRNGERLNCDIEPPPT
jgi:tetratricopeptide (TPR) repeat protein